MGGAVAWPGGQGPVVLGSRERRGNREKRREGRKREREKEEEKRGERKREEKRNGKGKRRKGKEEKNGEKRKNDACRRDSRARRMRAVRGERRGERKNASAPIAAATVVGRPRACAVRALCGKNSIAPALIAAKRSRVVVGPSGGAGVKLVSIVWTAEKNRGG
jgi:hypothetical protein